MGVAVGAGERFVNGAVKAGFFGRCRRNDERRADGLIWVVLVIKGRKRGFCDYNLRLRGVRGGHS